MSLVNNQLKRKYEERLGVIDNTLHYEGIFEYDKMNVKQRSSKHFVTMGVNIESKYLINDSMVTHIYRNGKFHFPDTIKFGIRENMPIKERKLIVEDELKGLYLSGEAMFKLCTRTHQADGIKRVKKPIGLFRQMLDQMKKRALFIFEILEDIKKDEESTVIDLDFVKFSDKETVRIVADAVNISKDHTF